MCFLYAYFTAGESLQFFYIIILKTDILKDEKGVKMREKWKKRTENFKFLFCNLYTYQKTGFLLPLQGCLAKVALALVTIYIPKRILDLLEGQADLDILLKEVLVLSVLMAAASVWNNNTHNAVDKCSQTFLYRRLIPMWQRGMMTMDYEILTSPVGKVAAEKARNTIESPNRGVVSYLPACTKVLESLAGLISFSVIIGSLHPGILAVLLLFFLFEMGYASKMEERKHGLQDKRATVTGKLNYLAYGTKGMQEGKDIRIYGMVPWLKSIMTTVVKEKDKIETRAATYQLRSLVLTGVLILLRDGLAYGYLIYCFLYTPMQIGDFALYFAAITGLGNWLTGLVGSMGGFLEADYFVESFREFMELPAPLEKGVTEECLKAPYTFTFENVSFSYVQEGEKKQEIPVFRNLNLTIAPKEKLAIVGVNGAGKTTLVKLLCGMVSPKEGRVLVNGIDIKEIPKKEYFKLFSAVFQDSGVLPVSIAENVMLNVRETQDVKNMWHVLRQAGLEEVVKQLPEQEMTRLVKEVSREGTELSGGQLQRLLLARALYKNAPVLLLDEPTAALDPVAESEIYEQYHQFTEEKSAVFISHRLASTGFCDRIIFLEEGSVLEEGSHEELLKAGGKYAGMFRVQSRYYQKEGSVIG